MSIKGNLCSMWNRRIKTGRSVYLIRSFLKGFLIVVFMLAVISIMQEQSNTVEVYPELNGYWSRSYNWTINGSIFPPGEKLSDIPGKDVAANIILTKGPPVDERGFDGNIIVANYSPRDIYVDSIKLNVMKHEKKGSYAIITAGDTLKTGEKKAYKVSGNQLPGIDSYIVKVTTVIKDSGYTEIDSNVGIETPGSPEITNDSVKLRGPGLFVTKGLIADYEGYSRIFSNSGTDRQVFKVRSLADGDNYLTLDYVIDETGQRLSLRKKIVP